jgi:hypothetical protein
LLQSGTDYPPTNVGWMMRSKVCKAKSAFRHFQFVLN